MSRFLSAPGEGEWKARPEHPYRTLQLTRPSVAALLRGLAAERQSLDGLQTRTLSNTPPNLDRIHAALWSDIHGPRARCIRRETNSEERKSHLVGS
jgi:hypothetical protein